MDINKILRERVLSQETVDIMVERMLREEQKIEDDRDYQARKILERLQ